MIRLFGREFHLTRRLRIGIVLSCFVAGLVIFFPVESLESRLNDSLSKALRMDVRISNPRLGLGLRTGLLSGGLLGLKAERLDITPSRSGHAFSCAQPLMSPKLIALLILRIQVAVRCDIGESAAPLFLVFRAPLYDFASASAEIVLDDVAADDVARFASIKGLAGILSGSVRIDSFSGGAQAMNISWDLAGREILTPGVVSDFASLPPMSFENIETKGSYMSSRLKIDQLTLGAPNKGPFYADLSLDFGLDPQGLPVSGFLSGKQKSDPAFEKSDFASVNLDLLFGKPKPSGMREFRKQVQGSPMSLLMPVEE